MNLIHAIVLGIVQGLTEFLPVSSTAHLILVPWFMGWTDPFLTSLTFDVSLHLGTLVALLIYFRQDWIDLAKSAIDYVRGKSSDALALYVVLATIPAGVLGLLFEKTVETRLRDPRVISASLILLALVLVVAENVGRRKKTLKEITLPDAMTVGFAQALALVPGVSRSGVTITAALFRGIKRDAAARFSFYLSTPLIGGAVAKKLLDVAKEGLPAGETGAFVGGIVASGIVGYFAIKLLLQYLQNHNTFVFVYYRIALGIVVYLAFWSGFR